MTIAVRTAAGFPPALARLARRRFEFALGRFDPRVRSARVRITDVNGPRGGADKKCLVTIRLDARTRLIVIEDTDIEAAVAIDRAADRAARAVARALHLLADWRSVRLAY